MVCTVTLNPCIDRTCEIAGFYYGETNRIIKDRRDVSGKGINVSIALGQNGVKSTACGFLYDDNKEIMLGALESLGILYSGVIVKGRARENIKLWDSTSGVTTEINQEGEFVPLEKWTDFKKHFLSCIRGCELVAISGSAPAGISKTAYRELIEIANQVGVPCILDANGSLLEEGLKANPLLIKPNIDEFVSTFVPQSPDRDSVVNTAKRIIAEGLCQYVCITLGKEGALFISENEVLFSPVLDVPVKCTQGAGDGFVAGICKAWIEKRETKRMFAYGVAMAGGTLVREGTQMCLPDDFVRLLSHVRIEVIK